MADIPELAHFGGSLERKGRIGQSTVVLKHLRVRRIWEYVYSNQELTGEEKAHLEVCPACRSVFKLCVLAEGPRHIDFEDDETSNP